MNKPAIIVIAYNRDISLKRLLNSLLRADVPNDVPLIISIDYSDNTCVFDIAEDFDWPFGDKIIIRHIENLGLRKHVLSCGDLTAQYGSVILLEDDLFVSPSFYRYTQQALDFYESDERVSGISLYSHQLNVNVNQKFEAISDGSDVFWLQFASSWGQAWNKNQWNAFRGWYETNQVIGSDDCLPDFVIGWPETSWLKYFIKYLIDTDKYFIYPRVGLTTNFSDVGTHVNHKIFDYQVALALNKSLYTFKCFEESLSIYDAYFELHSDVIKSYNKQLDSFDFDVDLYGSKSLNKLTSDYILTTKQNTSPPQKTFQRDLWPHDLNVLFTTDEDDVDLGEINFGLRSAFLDVESDCSRKTSTPYFRGDISIGELFSMFLNKVKRATGCG